MANTIGEAWVEIKPKTDNFGKDVEREVGGISQKLGSTFQKVGVGLTAAVTAPLIGLGAMAVKEATEARAGLAQMEAVIKSTGNSANLSAKEQVKLSESLGKLAGVEDDVVLAGQNMLRTFTGVRNEVGAGNDIFNQATLTALDMSAALGQDAKSSAIQLGKALNDPIQGVSALQRVGVTFTDAQKEQIKTMVEAGDTMGAQKLILAELNKEFGGSAKAQGDALGPMERFKLTLADLGGSVGAILLPFLDKLAAGFQKVADWFGKLSPEGQKIVLVLAGVAAAIGPVLIVVGSLIKSFTLVSHAFTAMSALLAANPFILLAAAAIALVALIVMNWDTIKAATATAWNWIKEHIGGIARGILAVVTGGLSEVVIRVVQNWNQIRATTAAIWNSITGFLSGVWNGIRSTASAVWNGITGVISGAVNAVRNVVVGAWNGVVGAINAARAGIGSAVNSIIGFFSHLWARASYYVNKVISAIRSLPFVPGSPIPMVVWAEETLKGMSRAFDKFPSPEMDWNPRASYGISRPALAGAGGGGAATYVFQIDGKEFARMTAPLITDEQIVTGKRTQVGVFGGFA